jgi:polysaccharide export outer membrane protein
LPQRAVTAAEPAGSAEIVPSASDLEVLGPHDLLEIAVFDVEQFSRTVRVSDDGAITLPFLGRIEVGGMTRVGLEQRIAALLGEKWVQDPQVSVFVKEYNSRKISVSGAVKNPSTFELLGRKTLLDVVSEAGGFTEDVGRLVYVVRHGPGGATERITIDLQGLVYRGDSAANLVIQPGDVIYAPIEKKITVYVNGAVKNPGGYDFKYGDQITVLRAVTKAGGTTERAAESKVQILRHGADGTQSAQTVDLRKIRSGKAPDPVLQEEDVVDVPEAFF